MSKEEPKIRCNMCNREREVSHIPCLECGTCVYCLAEMGDPTAIALIKKECRENGGYRGIDSIVVSGIAIDKPEVESTTEECDKCSREVWVSHGTRADAEKAAKEDGGNVIYLCMSCVPEAIVDGDLRVGEAQKDEMRIAGVDVEKFMKESGMTLEQIAQKMLKWGRKRDAENREKRMEDL